MWQAAEVTLPSPPPVSLGSPGLSHFGRCTRPHPTPGAQGQTLALEAVSGPPRSSRSTVALVLFSPSQIQKDLIQIPLFKFLK